MTLLRRIERLEQKQRQRVGKLRSNNDLRIQEAARDPYVWVTRHTKTYNEHWVEEGRPSSYEPFPQWPYIPEVFDLLQAERIVWLEKSRDMLVSWICVAYLTVEAMKVPERGVLFQTQKEDKVKELVRYAKCLYDHQPAWLKEAYPLSKSMRLQSDDSLEFAHGGKIIGVPGGADQIRSYHPWGYLNDESSFQPDAGECYNEALSAVKGKIIFNSSAAPGWYADARRDIVRSEEE
jgi:hypothetical protein